MGRYKVSVYAICKNEVRFVRRWMASMSEADEVVVLDTGSEDGTAELLRELGARVEVETVAPWRFDVARNRSLELVSMDADICVCTDLDEVFRPGWRRTLEECWTPGTGRARYRYTWSFEPDGAEGVVFYADKIHARRGWRWKHPVHEVLGRTGEEGAAGWAVARGVQLDHHPDPAKSRSQYLPLLELAVAEEPLDDRNMHYLGREYFFHGRWDDCIRTLERHLALPTATWADERSASMGYMARAWERKGNRNRAESWYLRAAAQAPHLREPWLDLALFLQGEQNWHGVLYAVDRALAITHRTDTYMTRGQSWGSLPWDLKGVALYRAGRMEEALEAAEQAARLAPGDGRIAANLELMRREKTDKMQDGMSNVAKSPIEYALIGENEVGC